MSRMVKNKKRDDAQKQKNRVYNMLILICIAVVGLLLFHTVELDKETSDYYNNTESSRRNLRFKTIQLENMRNELKHFTSSENVFNFIAEHRLGLEAPVAGQTLRMDGDVFVADSAVRTYQKAAYAYYDYDNKDNQ